MQKTRKGFTLVELVVVIAVIAILAGVLIGTFASVINKANESAKVQVLKQQEIEQKATDILNKLENSNWLGWEDFEANVVEALTSVVEKNSTTLTEAQVKQVVEDALASFKASQDATSLTKEQVEAIIENAIGKIEFSGVTEAQVRTIVAASSNNILSTQLTAAQVKSIINAAEANDLTAADVVLAMKNAGITDDTDLQTAVDNIVNALNTATSSLATHDDVKEIKDYLAAADASNVVTAKALNIKLEQRGITSVSYPYEVVSVVGETLLTTTDSTSTILLYIDPASTAPTFVVKASTGFVYDGGLTTSGIKNVDLWKFDTVVDTTYSTYLLSSYTSTEPIANLTTGLDVGENNEVTSITYVGKGSAQTAVIRTNGGTLTVNAKYDNVLHYGYADSVNVVDVATASYHENGTVKFLEVAAGHIVLEKDSDVSAVHFDATNGIFENADGKTISIDLSKVNANDISFSRDAVTIDENGTYVAEVTTDGTEYIWLFGNGIKEQMVVTDTTDPIAENGTLKAGIEAGAEDGSVAEQIANPAKRNTEGQLVAADGETVVTAENAVVEEVASKEDVQVGATLFAGGTGTESDPYLIATAEQFTTYQLGATYRKPVDVKGSTTKIGDYERYIFGDDYKTTYIKFIADIDLKGEYSMPDFDRYSFMLSNVVIDGNGYTISNGYTRNKGFVSDRWNGNVTIKNLTIDNSVLGVGLFHTGYYDPDAGNTLKLENVSVKNCSAYDASFVCFPSNKHVEIINSSVENGLVTYRGSAGSCGGFVGNGQNVLIDGCSFQGTIDANTGNGGGFIGQAGASSVYIKNSDIKSNTIIKSSAAKGTIGALAYSNLSAGNCENIVFNGILQSVDKTKANITGLDTAVYNKDSIWILYNSDITSDYISFDANTGTITYNGNNTYTKMVIEQRYNVDNMTNGVFYKGGFPRTIESVKVENVTTGTAGTISLISGLVQYIGNSNVNLGYSTTDAANIPANDDSFVIQDGKIYYNCGMSAAGTGNYISGTYNGNEPSNIKITIVVTMYDGENVVGSVSFTYTAYLK